MSRTRVAIVDDDPDLCALVNLACTKLGDIEIEAFSDPYEALEALGRCPPELLILDVMMPRLSGPDLLAELRQRWSQGDEQPMVAFLTAKVGPAAMASLRSEGAVRVWSKPFSPARLVGDIETLLSAQSGESPSHFVQ